MLPRERSACGLGSLQPGREVGLRMGCLPHPRGLPESCQVLRVSHGGVEATSPGHVDIKALAEARANLQESKEQCWQLRCGFRGPGF